MKGNIKEASVTRKPNVTSLCGEMVLNTDNKKFVRHFDIRGDIVEYARGIIIEKISEEFSGEQLDSIVDLYLYITLKCVDRLLSCYCERDEPFSDAVEKMNHNEFLTCIVQDVYNFDSEPNFAGGSDFTSRVMTMIDMETPPGIIIWNGKREWDKVPSVRREKNSEIEPKLYQTVVDVVVNGALINITLDGRFDDTPEDQAELNRQVAIIAGLAGRIAPKVAAMQRKE